MKARDLLSTLAKRIAQHQRWDRLLVAVTPCLIVALLWWATDLKLLPTFLILPLGAALAIFALYLLSEIVKHPPLDPKIQAATLLDHESSGKERFLTLATTEPTDNQSLADAIRAIEEQSDALAKHLETPKFNFSPSKPTRVSLALLPLVLICFGLVAWKSRALTSSLDHTVEAKQLAQLQLIRNLAEQLPPSAAELGDRLAAVADLVEEKGLHDEDTQLELDQALAKVEEQLDQDTITPDDLPTSQQPKSATPQPTPQSEQSQNPANSTENKQGATLKEGKTEEAQKTQSEESQKSTGESKGEKQQSQQSGDKSQEQRSTDDPTKQQQAKEGNKGNAPQPEEKKDVTGVGEGKGKGKNGADKPQQGETQSGTNSSGAKEGEAKNQSGDQNQDSSGEKEKSDNKQGAGDKQGDQSKSQREQGGKPGENSKTEQGKEQGKDGDTLNQIKEQLQDLKDQSEQNKLEQKEQGDKDSNQQGSQHQQEGSKAKNNQQGDKKTESSNGERDKNKEGENRSGDKADKPNDKNDTPGEQPQSSDPGKQQDGMKGAAKDQERKQPGDSQNKDGAKKENRDSSDSLDGNRDATQDPATSKEHRQPNPSDTAQRFGPFDGGTEGDLKGKGLEASKVEIPKEQKIIVRGLGAEENKLYRNKEGAKARTAIGETEFKKPEADVTRKVQPIPAEYGDLLR